MKSTYLLYPRYLDGRDKMPLDLFTKTIRVEYWNCWYSRAMWKLSAYYRVKPQFKRGSGLFWRICTCVFIW